MSFFDPVKDRQDYGSLLKPPMGYELEFAVGTTYSLDLSACIGISMVLGLGQNTDTELSDNPLCLMEALLKAGEKMAVFCQRGQMKVPYKPGALHAFLEKTVWEIKLKRKSNFHPKVWVAKYQNSEMEAVYRCLVMSRNLTFDRSWDVVAALEGRKGEKHNLKAEPLQDFLRYLASRIKEGDGARSKRRKIRKLADEIGWVAFNLEGTPFNDYCFHPFGIGDRTALATNLDSSYHEALVISPFLTSSVINRLNSRSLKHEAPHALITRKSELHKLSTADCDQFKIYTLKDIIVDGEDAFSESKGTSKDEIRRQQDIHGKLYLLTKNSRSRLFIGSANATRNAFESNVEFMMELEANRRYINVPSLLDSIFGEDGKGNPFEEVLPGGEISPKDADESQAESILKRLVKIRIQGQVIGDKGRYDLRLTIPSARETLLKGHVWMRPLFSNRELPLEPDMFFREVPMEKLTSFFKVRIQVGEASLSRLIKIPLEGIPEGRDQAIVRGVVSNRGSFMAYLNFILDDEMLASFVEGMQPGKGCSGGGTGASVPAVYEKMLKAAIHDPKKFESIGRIMRFIGEDGEEDTIVPREFVTLYETFRKVVK